MGLKKALKKVGKVVRKVATGDFIGAAATAANALIGSKGSKKAAGQSAGGHEASAEEQRAALDRVGGYQQPFYAMASPAINALMRTNAGDYSDFENSPDYLYARDEALSGVENSAAARGGLYSGNTYRALADTAGRYATSNLGNFRNALMGQIGIGQHSADTLTGATLNTARGVGADLSGAGDARASGVVGSTNAITGGVEDLAGLAGNFMENRLLKRKKPVGAAASPSKMQRLPSVTVPY